MSNVWNRSAIAIAALILPTAAFADISGTLTLTANTNVSMDSGSTVSSGGDFLWTGTALTPQGKTIALDATALLGATYSGAAGYSELTQSLLVEFALAGNSSPINGIKVNDVIGYETNGGNYGKILVTSLSGTSITFEYTTYGVNNGPTITGVQNNYSYILPGLPNYGIAPGTLFIIKGSDLAGTTSVSQLESSAAPGIPTTLNGASIAVTVNGVTTHPAMYYAIATQIAAVLPSSTPVGTGTITVTYNNTASNAASITVVQSALGLDTYYGSGSGLGVATDLSYNLITYTNSAKPGQSIILWGSGLGADTADSDTTVTGTPHAVDVPLTVYIGGVAVTPSYQGSSGYPGLNQINVTIPSSVDTGCGVGVVALSGTIVSNSVSLPIASGGGVCSDPLLGYTGTELSQQGGQSSAYNQGILSIGQSNSGNGLMTTAGGDFYSYPPGNTSSSGGGVTSIGNCTVTISSNSSTGNLSTIPGLDAGTITVSGPNGSQQLTNAMIPTETGPSGEYYAQLANSFIPATGGTFTFTATGGKTSGLSVGPFTASISYTNPLSWTNMSSITSVTRANGQNVTWSGGASGSFVAILGSSSSNAASASFICYAPASAGAFTVPPYVLLALPTSTDGSLGVSSYTTPVPFTASGLNTGTLNAGVSFTINPAYK